MTDYAVISPPPADPRHLTPSRMRRSRTRRARVTAAVTWAATSPPTAPRHPPHRRAAPTQGRARRDHRAGWASPSPRRGRVEFAAACRVLRRQHREGHRRPAAGYLGGNTRSCAAPAWRAAGISRGTSPPGWPSRPQPGHRQHDYPQAARRFPNRLPHRGDLPRRRTARRRTSTCTRRTSRRRRSSPTRACSVW